MSRADSLIAETGQQTAILIAEDDEAVREMLLSVLLSNGYEVIVAVDGEDAVQKYLQYREKIQLLLFDIVMPNKNGVDAYREITAHAPGILTIFASGYATSTLGPLPEGDNVTFITKPYLPSSLVVTVRDMLNRLPKRSP